MSEMIQLTAEDGVQLSALVAGNPETAKGGVVVLQEIFGLNAHIRDLPGRFAAAGYYAVAPAMFDRAEAGVELDYNADGKDRGIALKNAVDADAIIDVSAAVKLAAKAGYPHPDDLARKLIILKEGAIVMATMSHSSASASEAKEVAQVLLST